jgi:hypothetical protein
MLRDIAVLICAGTSVYVWLSLVAAPLVSGVLGIARAPLDGESWRGGALALSTAVLWTLIAGSAVVLLAAAAPRAIVAIAHSPVLPVAVLAGLTLWIARSLWLGMPRLSVDAEVASALAIVSLVNDDRQMLRRVEQLYIERVLARPTSFAVTAAALPRAATARSVPRPPERSTPSLRRRAG